MGAPARIRWSRERGFYTAGAGPEGLVTCEWHGPFEGKIGEIHVKFGELVEVPEEQANTVAWFVPVS